VCGRYIRVLNLVRAAMVADPVHYRGSSYRANALGQNDPLITPHPVYSPIDGEDADRQAAYRALFRRELDAEVIADIRLALDQGQPLCNGRFLDTIERMTGQRREVKPRGRPRKPSPQDKI
jgi:putative transposase